MKVLIFTIQPKQLQISLENKKMKKKFNGNFMTLFNDVLNI
jgi:hypothetical protein